MHLAASPAAAQRSTRRSPRPSSSSSRGRRRRRGRWSASARAGSAARCWVRGTSSSAPPASQCSQRPQTRTTLRCLACERRERVCCACGRGRRQLAPWLAVPALAARASPCTRARPCHAMCRDRPMFDLDVGELERRYKALQRRLHPDKYSTGACGWVGGWVPAGGPVCAACPAAGCCGRRHCGGCLLHGQLLPAVLCCHRLEAHLAERTCMRAFPTTPERPCSLPPAARVRTRTSRRIKLCHTTSPLSPIQLTQLPPPPAASSLELEYAHQQAAVVNQAYDVLKKPLRRAHYIVSCRSAGCWAGAAGGRQGADVGLARLGMPPPMFRRACLAPLYPRAPAAEPRGCGNHCPTAAHSPTAPTRCARS